MGETRVIIVLSTSKVFKKKNGNHNNLCNFRILSKKKYWNNNNNNPCQFENICKNENKIKINKKLILIFVA